MYCPVGAELAFPVVKNESAAAPVQMAVDSVPLTIQRKSRNEVNLAGEFAVKEVLFSVQAEPLQ
ncbi:MAG: hypothetical protein PHW14_03545 [Candidatus Omnitrophica bacterium]|nr:hypothetical protein [Candidatus Omnitrophota bacterium]